MLKIICKSRHKADSSNLKRWASKQEWKGWGHPLLRYSVGANKSDCTKKGQRGEGEGPDKQLARVGQSCLLVTFGVLFWKCNICFLLLICIVFPHWSHCWRHGKALLSAFMGLYPSECSPCVLGSALALTGVPTAHSVPLRHAKTHNEQCPHNLMHLYSAVYDR